MPHKPDPKIRDILERLRQAVSEDVRNRTQRAGQRNKALAANAPCDLVTLLDEAESVIRNQQYDIIGLESKIEAAEKRFNELAKANFDRDVQIAKLEERNANQAKILLSIKESKAHIDKHGHWGISEDGIPAFQHSPDEYNSMQE
jgi:hypothetical protein